MDNFDWVTARANCSLRQVYSRLRAGFERDVEARHALGPEDGGEPRKFSTTGEHGTFSVLQEWPTGGTLRAVRLTLKADHLAITSEDGQLSMRITLTLNDDGDCRLVVDGAELREWQVRKRALERLFFG